MNSSKGSRSRVSVLVVGQHMSTVLVTLTGWQRQLLDPVFVTKTTSIEERDARRECETCWAMLPEGVRVSGLSV